MSSYLIKLKDIEKLIPLEHKLTKKQKQDILKALKENKDVIIKTAKTQIGGNLDFVLGKIGSKKGKGAPRLGVSIQPKPRITIPGKGAPNLADVLQPPPPFIGTWEKATRNQLGYGSKKKIFKILKPRFSDKIPMTNFDLLEWCKYLNIPINDVVSRDSSPFHNHKLALIIYNLEPHYLEGSHWIATFVKNRIINYFDSFGMPPFQEIVNHAKKKKLTLLHQDNQIQDLKTTTCGYFCIYFLNEMNKGKSYYDLLSVFDNSETRVNEKFIKSYFNKL